MSEIIDSNKVERLFNKCLLNKNEFKNREPIVPSVEIKGIKSEFVLSKDRLEKRKNEILKLIGELPKEFHEGYSFLNMCFTKDKDRWTKSHHNCEQLMVLGLAIDKLEYLYPRDEWGNLPEEMPYIKIKN